MLFHILQEFHGNWQPHPRISLATINFLETAYWVETQVCSRMTRVQCIHGRLVAERSRNKCDVYLACGRHCANETPVGTVQACKLYKSWRCGQVIQVPKSRHQEFPHSTTYIYLSLSLIGCRLEAIALRLEGITIRLEAPALSCSFSLIKGTSTPVDHTSLASCIY